MTEFSQFAPSAPAVFYRSYSRRKADGSRESFQEAMTRTISAIAEVGKFTEAQTAMCLEMALKQHCFPSGRALWVAGTEWSKKPENYPGYYNCCSMHADEPSIFGLLMELAMMGTGTGAVLEKDVVDNMPPIQRKVNIHAIKNNDGVKGGDANTSIKYTGLIEERPIITIKVGDSREGWASAYEGLIALAMGHYAQDEEVETAFFCDAEIILDLSHVRQAGEPLKGFGGTANPVRLQETFERAARLLSKAKGRKLTSIECCLLIDEAASAVVAGNIRRSAGMRQFSSDDEEAASAKDGLYKQDENGNWSVDPEKEALRMANHTRCFHTKPDYETIKASIEKQFWSGEGAIMYVPESIARANADLLSTPELKQRFLDLYVRSQDDARQMLMELAEKAGEPTDERIIQHRMDRYGLNPCLTGDTKILTVHHGPCSFEDLAKTGEDILVWTINKETNEAAVRMMRNPRITGYNQPVVEIEFDSGLKVKATHNHNFFTLHRNKVQAKDLKVGQSVAAFAIHQHRDGHLRIVRNNKDFDCVRQQFCHRIIAEHYGITGEVIHHIDGNPLNNDPLNLEATTHIEHNQEHYANRVRNGFYHGTPGGKAKELIANHKVIAIRDAGNATVYNGTVDDFHNYVVVDPDAVGKSYVSGVLSANCGEIIMCDNQCNLSEIHLNTIDPSDLELQRQAFYAGGLQVAALLQHKFVPERLAYSRENDPIVGVSFTGLFDFFVHAFGAPWLKWMMKGRPGGVEYKNYDVKEKKFLRNWRISAEQGVRDYCEQHGIRVPNRFTTVQPAGSKSLLTGASSGWHPPKAQRFIRRITFGVNDPLVSALRDYGYNVIPAQSARDEQGNLLDDINDPRVREVLVEIPTEVSWANLPGCDEFDLNKLPVSAQWGLYMQVQNEYTQHNTSATLEFRQDEIDSLSALIYQNIQSDGGYISAALLARFDANETFPRLPFEPIDKQTYDRRTAVVNAIRSGLPEDASVLSLLKQYDHADYELKGAAGCDSAKCLSESGKDADQAGLIN